VHTRHGIREDGQHVQEPGVRAPFRIGWSRLGRKTGSTSSSPACWAHEEAPVPETTQEVCLEPHCALFGGTLMCTRIATQLVPQRHGLVVLCEVHAFCLNALVGRGPHEH
jgi:hypothetical protein